MSNLLEALAGGATVVTPNNRLARDIAVRFDAARRAEDARTWTAATVLPFALWLERLWRMALASGVQQAPPLLVEVSATRALWHAIVARHGRDWLNARGAARHAAEAWALFHRFRDADETLAGVTARALHDDPRIFGQWAERYQSRLASLRAIDEAQLPDTLAGIADAKWLDGRAGVILHGFIALTPQQRRLVAALRNAGMAIDACATGAAAPAHCHRVALPTPRDELARAFGFARDRLVREPQARIAIVVADLDERRGEILALAEETLCAEQLLALSPDIARPYGISLGEPLAAVPLVACALDLIALGCGPIEATNAASVVRARFLPDAATRGMRRAECEEHWVKLGLREIGWQDMLVALRSVDAPLQQRFAALVPPPRAPRLPREWARVWSDWLRAIGWPGSATLASGEWQAREAWSAALARFASIGTMTGALSPIAALDALRALLTETLFQPQSAPAPIQILGVLEAAGLSFDHAWLAGFDAQRWPGTAAPNPFLPLAWQQARHVPRAHPETVIAQAADISAALRVIAREIIVSHASTIDEAPATVSPLFADWPPIDAMSLPPALRIGDVVSAATMESVVDASAPALAHGARVHGGAAIFDSQSACPFQSYARHRLRVAPWPRYPEGLSAAERGDMLHATLKAFWDDVGDQSTLLGLDAAGLAARIDRAARIGRSRIAAPRWRALAPPVANAEASRLAATLRAWIDEGERTRPPFRVHAHEARVGCEIEGLAVSIRVDRVDSLPDGSLAIIDYKSGNVVPPVRWFAPRPEGIQLAVYAEAIGPTLSAPIHALAYAQVKAGAIAVTGLAESLALWPALASAESLRPPLDGWTDARSRLRDRLAALAQDIRRGVADVAPRSPGICAYCGLQSLCRFQVLADGASDGDADE